MLDIILLNLFEEAGAERHPGMVYYRVKTALEAEYRLVAQLQTMRADIVRFLSVGKLTAADQTLNRALLFGLTPGEYESLLYRVEDQRSRAASFVRAGDSLYDDGKFKESLERYGDAARLDVNHRGLTAKLAMAESAHKSARAQTTIRTLGIIGSTVEQVLSSYFESRHDRDEQEEEQEEEAEEEDENHVELRKIPSEEDSARKDDEDDEDGGEDEEKPEPVQPVLIRIPASKAKPPGGPPSP